MGTVVGGPRPESIFNRFSFDFDGTDDYVQIDNVDFTSLTNFSISLWLKAAGFKEFFSVFTGGGQPNLIIGIRANDRIDIYVGGNLIYKNFVINQTDWNHILITYDLTQAVNSDKVKCYIAGSEITLNGSTSLTTLPTGLKTVYLGRRVNNYLKGNLDEVAIFNSTLSTGEVATIYNNGVPNDISSLSPLSWWRMGDKATYSNPGGVGNWTLTDQGSGGNDGTSNGMDESNRVLDTP